MKRVIILVIDSMGVGAMADAPDYGDSLDCNTLSNVAKFNHGLNIPHLQTLGLGNITSVEGAPAIAHPTASFGRLEGLSEGKDTTTGHWEMAGLVLDKPFKVYPNGFPEALMQRFVKETGCKGYFGNIPASGTAIIEQYNQQHLETGYPIIYTSADSVFQIACNLSIVPIETLYSWCEIARELLNDEFNTSRVIARPYQTTDNGLERIAALRHDYSVEPMKPTILNMVQQQQGKVIAIGKIEDIFVGSGVTHAIHTGSNHQGLELTVEVLNKQLDLDSIKVNDSTLSKDADELIFINLVDTDMLFGHRNDAAGYGKAIEEIDTYIPKITALMNADDLLIITADHGCDPTQPGTDHTREMIPLLSYNQQQHPIDIGTKKSFTYIAHQTAKWLNIPSNSQWAM